MAYKITTTFKSPNKSPYFTWLDQSTIEYLNSKYPDGNFLSALNNKTFRQISEDMTEVEFTLGSQDDYVVIITDPLVIERKSAFDNWNKQAGIEFTIIGHSI
jgi:hypothetical protein